MRRLQAFKYELMPSGEQRRQMRRFAGACRFVYNKALALQKQRYEQGEKKLSYAGLCRALTQWRNGEQTPWLKEAPVHPLQQSLKDLERAYGNFFARRADFPRFKKKGRHSVMSCAMPCQRAISVSGSEADQARSNPQPPLPAEARLDALPQQPQGAG